MATFGAAPIFTFINPFLDGSAARNPLGAINVLNTWRFGGAASTAEIPTNAFNQGLGMGMAPFGLSSLPPLNAGAPGFGPQLQGFPNRAFDTSMINPGMAWNAGLFNNAGFAGFNMAGVNPFTQAPPMFPQPMGFFV
jgi:hypothetical protein